MPGLVPNDAHDAGLQRGFETDRLPLRLMIWLVLGLLPGLVPNDAHDAGLQLGFWTDRLPLMLMMLACFGAVARTGSQ